MLPCAHEIQTHTTTLAGRPPALDSWRGEAAGITLVKKGQYTISASSPSLRDEYIAAASLLHNIALSLFDRLSHYLSHSVPRSLSLTDALRHTDVMYSCADRGSLRSGPMPRELFGKAFCRAAEWWECQDLHLNWRHCVYRGVYSRIHRMWKGSPFARRDAPSAITADHSPLAHPAAKCPGYFCARLFCSNTQQVEEKIKRCSRYRDARFIHPDFVTSELFFRPFIFCQLSFHHGRARPLCASHMYTLMFCGIYDWPLLTSIMLILNYCQ